MNSVMTKLNSKVTLPLIKKEVPVYAVVGVAVAALVIGAVIYLKITRKI